MYLLTEKNMTAEVEGLKIIYETEDWLMFKEMK